MSGVKDTSRRALLGLLSPSRQSRATLRLVLVVHYGLDRIKRLIASTSDAVRNVFCGERTRVCQKAVFGTIPTLSTKYTESGLKRRQVDRG